jgi:hypothetical protein
VTAPPVPSSQPLVNALKAACTTRGLPFGDGGKPAGLTNGVPYVVAWVDAGRVTDRTLRGRDGFRVVGTFHAVGSTPDSARIAATKLRQAVLSLHRMVVGGWQVQLPVHAPALTMDRDDDVSPSIWFQADEWSFQLTPA